MHDSVSWIIKLSSVSYNIKNFINNTASFKSIIELKYFDYI